METQCTCDNVIYGFNCSCKWVKDHPGNIEYTCEFCGIYQAGKPKCSKCEGD